MKGKKTLAISLISLFLFSGCLGIVDPEVNVPDVVLPDDWSTIPSRTVASPQLFSYDDCQDLEEALKQSIEEEYRIQLLQAVQEQYSYGGVGIWDDVAFAEDSAAAEGGNTATTRSTPTRVAGEDFSETNNQEAGVDEADFVKTDG